MIEIFHTKGIRELSKQLDDLVSKYVKLRDYQDYGYCVSCGAGLQPGTGEAGHLIPRGNKNVRWHEDNVHLQCFTCNNTLRGNVQQYRLLLVKRIGEDRVVTMEAIADLDMPPWTREELRTLIDKFKKKIRSYQ